MSPPHDPALTLRRSMLVNARFEYVEEIQNLDAGYALRFRRSYDRNDREALIGAIADYIIFECRNAPQLTFEIVDEPHHKTFWLQISGLHPHHPDSTSTSLLSHPAVPYLS